jgi:hypothetical protein
MPRDPEKARARKARYHERQKVAKYGPGAAGVDMRGRHGNHARGAANGKWAGGKLLTSHGYVALRVPVDHPHAWGPPGLHDFRYAYEHVLVMVAHLGRPLRDNELVHHKNEDKTDNRLDNLELTVSEHAREHSERRGRDDLGRFPPADMTLQPLEAPRG